mmetsp:Transcript_35209/g.51648  ORF Transcript_35209/g.51648 Transcript_35209/m.51648 type:complete len:83 (-) Transcript_35209:2969-3217(-)
MLYSLATKTPLMSTVMLECVPSTIIPECVPSTVILECLSGNQVVACPAPLVGVPHEKHHKRTHHKTTPQQKDTLCTYIILTR